LKCVRLPATKKRRATPNVKILVLSQTWTMGGLKVNAQGSTTARWKAQCRLISDNTVKRNLPKSAFSEGVTDTHTDRQTHDDG